MYKKIILALGVMLSLSAKAVTVNDVIATVNQNILSEKVLAPGFDWKVGDTASYSLNMGFIKGSMVMTVKSLTADLLTLSQDLDLGFAGKQACEMTINPNTGETKSMVCNGQNQEIPNKDDSEVVDIQDDTVKVPAGSFQCLHITIKQKKDGKVIEQWANPKLVPVVGLVKTIAPGPFGQVTIELTSFKKN